MMMGSEEMRKGKGRGQRMNGGMEGEVDLMKGSEGGSVRTRDITHKRQRKEHTEAHNHCAHLHILHTHTDTHTHSPATPKAASAILGTH